MLRKRGLLQNGNWKKMRKSDPQTRLRRKEITRIVKIIATLEVSQELEQLEQLLFDLGTANTSEASLNSIPHDFLFLNDIFV